MDIQNPEKIEIEGLRTIHKLCKFGAEHNMEGCSFTEIVERMFDELNAKAQAVPEEKGRSDFEIIDQTIELVDLIASSNRFQRDKSKPFPFESNNPRNIEWWRLACKIQELLTDTDPDNCDFDEYKTMIKARGARHD